MTSDPLSMRTVVLMSLFIFSGLAAWADDAPPYWPLAKGTYWVYEGDVSWLERNPDTGQNEVRQKHLTWRSEVTDCLAIEGNTVALLHGSPLDLCWYDSTRQPSDMLLVKVGPDYYRVRKDAAAIFDRIKAAQSYAPPAGANPQDEDAELLLAGPLVAGKKYGLDDTSLHALFNDRYCSLVDGPAPFDLRSVRGAPKINHPQAYSITCHTSPDNDEIDFVPGMGIIGYSYNHHGTTMTVDVTLKEFGVTKN